MVGNEFAARKADEMSHLVQHDERAQLGVLQREERAASQKDPVPRNAAALVELSLPEEAVGKSKSDAWVAGGIGLERPGAQRC